MKNRGRNNVLMLGPDLDTKGGVAQVVNDYRNACFFNLFKIRYIPTYTDKSNLLKIWYFAKSICEYLLFVNQSRVVHVQSSYGWSFRRKSFFIVFANFFNKKTILHIHGSKFDTWYNSIRGYEKNFVKWILLNTDIIITLSKSWQNKLIEIQPKCNPIILLNAVDITDFKINRKRKKPQPPFRVLFLGRIGERKGVYDILDAIKLLPKNKFKFVIAGDGEIKKAKTIVKNIGRLSDVSIPGWVGKKEKIELLRNSDLMVLPSYNEGLPISILESLAFGLPIISTDVGGITLAVKDGINGLIVPTGNPAILAKSIEKIFSDLQRWIDFSTKSFEIFDNNFVIDKLRQRLELIYRFLS